MIAYCKDYGKFSVLSIFILTDKEADTVAEQFKVDAIINELGTYLPSSWSMMWNAYFEKFTYMNNVNKSHKGFVIVNETYYKKFKSNIIENKPLTYEDGY
jgi:hypothetical protein